jgi:branched-chain amino acid transport system substrate-binding protein
MSTKRLSMLVAFLLLVVLAIAPVSAQETETIRVYTSWPLQGAMTTEGDSMVAAARLALDHYLEDHDGKGPAGFSLELVVLDDASPTTGSWDGTVEAENAQRCVNDPLCMVYFGTYNSGAAKVSMPITNEAGIAQITPANTYPGLTHPWDTGEPDIYRPSGKINYFRTNPSDDLQGWSGAAWAQCLGFTKVYILDDRQLYGKGVADAFEQRAGEIGLEVVGRSGVEATDIDFRALITDVRRSGADLVYGGFVIDSGGVQIIQQMDALGLFAAGVKFMGPDGLVSPALVDQVGGAEVLQNNVYLTFPGLTPDQLTSRNGHQPIGWSTYAYQSMQVILNSIERAGKADRQAILEAMRETKDFEGITGTFGFDKNGDTTLIVLGGNDVNEGSFRFLGPISPDMTGMECPGAAS